MSSVEPFLQRALAIPSAPHGSDLHIRWHAVDLGPCAPVCPTGSTAGKNKNRSDSKKTGKGWPSSGLSLPYSDTKQLCCDRT